MLTFGVSAPDIVRTKQLLAHIPGAAEKAISRSINRALNSAKTEAIRGVKGRYTISDAELRKGIKIIPASVQRLKATLVATSSLQRVAKFKTGKGPYSEIVRGRSRSWPYSFFARLKGPKGGSHLGLFSRTDDYTIPSEGRYARTKQKHGTKGVERSAVGSPLKRQKIVEAVSVSTSEMVGHFDVLERTLEIAGEKLVGELDRQVELFLSGKVK